MNAQATHRLQQAIDLHRQGQLGRARVLYEEILSGEPRHFDALHLLGVMAAQSGDAARAVALIGRALAVDASHAAAQVNYGLALKELGRLDAALASFRQASVLDARLPEPWYLSGLIQLQLARYTDALADFRRAIALRADFAEAHCAHGSALRELQQPQAALMSYDRAIELKGDLAAAFSNRGLVLKELGQLQAALDSYERAIALQSDFAEAFYNRGLLLKQLRRFDAALASYDRAIALKPGYADAHCDRGNLLKELKDPQTALASYERALALKPDFAEAHANRGNVLRDLLQHESALQAYDAALACSRAPRSVRAMRLHVKMHIARWDDLEAESRRLAADIERGEPAAHPFCVVALTDDLALQRMAAESWVGAECPADHSLGGIGGRLRHERIRVGYFSADLREHAVATLMAGVFEAHDRKRFEVSAFSFGPDTGDPMRRRLEGAFEHFIDVRYRSDAEIAQLARQLEIDIAVDLGGFTADGRPRIFAQRAAPLQVSYLGYVGTMGAPYMDYLIADATLIPQGAQRHYAEKIVYLPSYQANDSRRVIAGQQYSRAELGLPAAGMVYCCFNASYKITPRTFDSWMRILQATPESVLFLYAGSAAVVDNLRSEALSRGVAGERLIFGGKLPFPQYLARYRSADLFLDTLPYNAGTTASDALWAGLPVLTCAGEALAARMGASVLQAVGLPELITESLQQYERLAIELGQERERLEALRHKLAANHRHAPLFDTALFARHLESAYSTMYERYRAGAPPEHIDVESQH
jgi:predicted O-linked N-acetylglucosamine transferase (SPINDLY family)